MMHRLAAVSTAAAMAVGFALLSGGVASAAENGSGPDSTAPSGPADLLYTPLPSGFGGILEWGQSTDDVSPVYEVSYRLYHDGERVTPLRNTNHRAESFNFGLEVDFGFNPLPNGEYTVTAVDEAGNESAPSAPILIDNLTDVTPPSTPPNFTFTPSGPAGTVSGFLDWDPSIDDMTVVGIRYQLYLDGLPVEVIAPGEGGHRVDFAVEIYACANETLRSGNYTVTAFDRAGNESAPTAPIHVDLG